MKKIIAMLLCIGLVLSLATIAFAAETITIDPTKPTEKVVDKEFHPYDWDPNSGVDHRSRAVSADGLQYADDAKTTINFAAHDSYTYTVDVPAAGKYELHIQADSDRDVDIFYTVNGGTEASGKFLGHTNGAGYSNTAEDALLGEVTLVKGANTLSFTIKENKNHNVTTFGYTLVPKELESEEPEVLPEILKGTPVVDGKLDALYEGSYTFKIDNKNFASLAAQNDNDALEATVYFLHDGEWMYICAVVTGDSEIIDTNKSWPLDGVDIWFLTPSAPSDPTRTKITMEAFASPSGEFNAGAYENSLEVDMTKVVNVATQDQANNSYITEVKLPIPYASESEGTVVINVQLNNAYSSGDFGSYGEQFGGNPDTLLLSATAAEAPKTEGDQPDNPNTGDALAMVIAMMAVATLGIVVIGKKKF